MFQNQKDQCVSQRALLLQTTFLTACIIYQDRQKPQVWYQSAQEGMENHTFYCVAKKSEARAFIRHFGDSDLATTKTNMFVGDGGKYMCYAL
jgi:hypothetical protein